MNRILGFSVCVAQARRAPGQQVIVENRPVVKTANVRLE
jgi:hypothetical protein